MEMKLCKNSLSCYEKVYDAALNEDAAAEIVVPDSMPDIQDVLFADGMVFLRSKETSEGRLCVGGTVKAYVLYQPEGGLSAEKLEVDIPYQILGEDSQISEECLTTAVVRLHGMDVRILNSRKVSIRAALFSELSAYLLSERVFYSETVEQPIDDMFVKTTKVSFDEISAVQEKSFVLTDEYPLSGMKSPVSELIGQSVELFAEDVKKVGMKIVFNGVVKTDLLWKCEDGSISSGSFTSGFSQILETDSAADDVNTQIRLILNGAYFEMSYISNEGRNISAQLNILAQSVSTERHEMNVLDDAYSNAYPLKLICGEESSLKQWNSSVLRDNMHGTIETVMPIREVVQSAAKVGRCQQTDTGFKCPIHVRVLLCDEDGQFQCLERCFTAEWELPEGELRSTSVVYVSCPEVKASPTGEGVEVRLLALAYAVKTETNTITPITAIEADTEHPIDKTAVPSVTVLPEKCDDLWTLAKRYHSTVELIREVNEGNTSSVLLIPKAR